MISLQDILIPVAHAQTTAQSTSPVAVLGLNWNLFIAQLVNFAIVLFILWKWVFTPVAKKLEQRTARIEKSLNDAERITKEKQEFEKWRDGEMSKARIEASAIVTAAQTDAVRAKDEVLKQTKEEQQKLLDQAKKQIEQEKNQAMAGAKAELADLVTGVAEKILKEKMNGKKDEEMIKEMLKSI